MPQLPRRSAFLKTSLPALTRTIKGIEDVKGLHRGLKTLSVIGPTLSRNQGVITHKERVPGARVSWDLDAHSLGTVDRSGLMHIQE
jgi:hypothetical protein